MAQAEPAQIDKCAAAEILHDRQVVRPPDGDQLAQRDVGGEADDAIVAGVHLQQQRGVRADRTLVVCRMRAIGGADLSKDGAALGENIRDAERAADFHQLAARHHHFLAAREAVDCHQHGGGVVIDDRRRLRASQVDEEPLDRVFASSPPAVREVVLQIDRAGGDAVDRIDRRLRQQGTPEIGVEDRSGGVHDRHEAVPAIPLDAPGHGAEDRRVIEPSGGHLLAVSDPGAQLVEHRPTVPRDILTAQADEPRFAPGVREKPVD